MTPTEPRVLVCDDLDPAALDVFREEGVHADVRTGMSENALVETVGDYQGVVVRSATKITARVIEAATELRVIGRAGIGVDNIDTEAATGRGIVVMNTPLGNSTTTAELALSLLLSLARHIPRAAQRVREGNWKKKDLVGTEITGKTLGVVGLGRIGRIVADRARGLGMRIVAHDPYLSSGDGAGIDGIDLMELDDLLGISDFVSLHVPLTKSTRGLISWEALARIKPGARLVNASRGGVVDEEAVLDALREGRLAGAAFDVLENEPPPVDHPLLTRDDVIVTPHLGASSEEAQLRVAVDIARQVARFIRDGVAENAVNCPSLPDEARQRVAPFLVLAEKLGSFAAQRLGGPIRKLELTVAGEVARFGVEHLRLALLTGVLRDVLETGVNFVNAPRLAKERGVQVLERTEEEATYPAGQIEIRATEKDTGATVAVVGTVFGREPHLVEIDGTRLDFRPKGAVIVTRHHDRPGVVGAIGSLLGEHAVNIHRIEVGPPEGGADGLAYGFLALSSEPGPEVVEAIAALDAIVEVQLLVL